jgi:hypothetical protein
MSGVQRDKLLTHVCLVPKGQIIDPCLSGVQRDKLLIPVCLVQKYKP